MLNHHVFNMSCVVLHYRVLLYIVSFEKCCMISHCFALRYLVVDGGVLFCIIMCCYELFCVVLICVVLICIVVRGGLALRCVVLFRGELLCIVLCWFALCCVACVLYGFVLVRNVLYCVVSC